MLAVLYFFLCNILSVTFCDENVTLEPQAKFATPCTTPNNDFGVCIEIQKCPTLMASLLRNQESSSYDFLIASRCGPINENPMYPKVCCGEYSNFVDGTTTSTKRPTRPPVKPFPEMCGNQSMILPSRIFGGTEATLGEFPWMVRLRHRSASGRFSYGCGGFLISEYFILTAAHCVLSKELAALGPIYQVQLGEHNTARSPDCEIRDGTKWCAEFPQVIKAGKPKVHPEYSNNVHHHNDIALIPLKEPVKFTETVYPICLASDPTQESEMWVSGWGKTETGPSSPTKLKVLVRRSNKTSCVSKYRNVNVRVLHSQLCAGGEEGMDSCSGDSGGPLMVQQGLKPWQAEGIVSFGLGCGIKGWPGVYTSIPSYIPWISKVIKHHLRKHVDVDNSDVTRY